MWFATNGADYVITRWLFQRALALVYLLAFIAIVHQFLPLLGEKGLLPVPQFVKRVSFWEMPSLFFFWPNDRMFLFCGWLGVGLSLFTLTGLSERFGLLVSMGTWFLLWLLYLSFVNVGQTFYAFGWETMLLEAGFLTIFLGDLHTTPPVIVLFLFRWMLFRVMFGAGLIKLRGDHCWRDLTCLQYHYETQPMPNPLSWYFGHLPKWMLRDGVLVNHFVELIAPFGYFAAQPIAALAGATAFLFQGILFVGGNYAFLGFLTMVLSIPTLDDRVILKIFPFLHPFVPQVLTTPLLYTYGIWCLVAVIALLSVRPLLNLFSPYQAMNASFEPLHLVNTYGAFGSVTKERDEIIIEGTSDATITPSTRWREYEFFGKPGDVAHLPPQIAPYHLRLDWLMWFAAMDSAQDNPWFVHLLEKLLVANTGILRLLRKDPFNGSRPMYIRAELYRYQFTSRSEHQQTGAWWKREFVREYFPVVSLQDTQFKNTLEEVGWWDN